MQEVVFLGLQRIEVRLVNTLNTGDAPLPPTELALRRIVNLPLD